MKNNSSLKRKITFIKICYKLNKEFSTDGVTLIVKSRPQFFEEQRFVNEAVKFPVALLENAKVTIIHDFFVTVRLRYRNSPSAYQTHF